MPGPSLPIPPLTISTPRLHLRRLTDTSEGSRDVQLYHENWSNAGATAWSLQGTSPSLTASRQRMLTQITESDVWFYSVFLAPSPQHPQTANPGPKDPAPQDLGPHIGSVSLRLQPSGPTLLPPVSFADAEAVGSGGPLSAEEVAAREAALADVEMQFRVLGYALFADYTGKGYATEACRGLLGGYSSSIAAWRASPDTSNDAHTDTHTDADVSVDVKLNTTTELMQSAQNSQVRDRTNTQFYIEAGVDIENPGSQRVLQKLGFRTVGMKIEAEKAWLNGGWRGPGWWITGMYL